MKYLLLTILGLFPCASFAQAPRVCVVNFERPLAPQTQLLDKVFAGRSDVHIIHNARPTDVAACIQMGAEEIILLAHALITSENKDGDKPANLGFFLDLKGEQRASAIKDWLQFIEEEITRIRPYGKNHGDPEVQKYLRKLRSQKQRLQKFSEEQPFFIVRPILPQAFRVAKKAATEKQLSPEGLPLKKIRLLSCIPHQVLAQYDDLRGLIEENHIELDIAPKNAFWSFVKGMDVTNPDIDWLKQSL